MSIHPLVSDLHDYTPRRMRTVSSCLLWGGGVAQLHVRASGPIHACRCDLSRHACVLLPAPQAVGWSMVLSGTTYATIGVSGFMVFGAAVQASWVGMFRILATHLHSQVAARAVHAALPLASLRGLGCTAGQREPGTLGSVQSLVARHGPDLNGLPAVHLLPPGRCAVQPEH